MTRLNALLALALVASALALVKTSYEWRRAYAGLDREREREQQLEAEYKRLDSERRGQSTHLLVEKTARERLQMRPATPALTVYVADAAASAVAMPGAPR